MISTNSVLLRLGIILAPAFTPAGCGEETRDDTTATAASPTIPAAQGTSKTPTTEGKTIDEKLLGTWMNEQGIEPEFTSDGVVFLRFQEMEADSPYSATDGRISYVDFEPNKEGEFLPTEVGYTVEGDMLVWDVGGSGELTLTRER